MVIEENFDLNHVKKINLLNLFCHRLPERTFKIKGHYFPVCSRCTGLYVGVFTFFVYSSFIHIHYSNILLLTGLLITLPTLIDGLTQLLGYRESNNILRFLTGLIGGVGLLILTRGIKFIILNN